jgi:ribosomal protein L19E
VSQVIECLLSKCEVLSPNLSTKRKKERKEGGREEREGGREKGREGGKGSREGRKEGREGNERKLSWLNFIQLSTCNNEDLIN